MNLVDVMADIERRYQCSDGPPCAWCPTGEPYVTLAIGGIKREGQPMPVVCNTEQEAIDGWKQSFDEYAASRTGRLYWRHRPEIETKDDKVVVYCRLIITDKPAREE